MPQPPQTFLSKAWSGSSMVVGAETMLTSFLEQDLPDDLEGLEAHVQDCSFVYMSNSTSPACIRCCISQTTP